MKKNVLFRNGFVASAILFASISAYTSSSQAPQNRNGSPASNGMTCANASCHSGPSASDQSISITTDIPASGFQSNTEYTITVIGKRGTSSASRSGFQASFESSGGFEGTISSGGASNVTTVGMGNFASHSGAQVFTSGESQWTFKWNSGNAPDGTTIYTVVNFANGNGSTSGDVVITETLSLTKAQNISIEENAVSNLSIYPNPAQNSINISFKSNGNTINSISVYDLQGRIMNTLFEGTIEGDFNASYTIDDLSPGVYILNIQNERGFKQERIIIQ